MKDKDTLRKNKIKAFRAFEAAHDVWFNLSVFTDAGRKAKIAMDKAKAEYIAAIKAEDPSTIVF